MYFFLGPRSHTFAASLFFSQIGPYNPSIHFDRDGKFEWRHDLIKEESEKTDLESKTNLAMGR
jgi:hypothetical protein